MPKPEEPISLGEMLGRLGVGGFHSAECEVVCALCATPIVTIPTLHFMGVDADDSPVLGMTAGRMQQSMVDLATHMVDKHTDGYNSEARKLIKERLEKLIGESELGN